jgi:hypothetical protein
MLAISFEGRKNIFCIPCKKDRFRCSNISIHGIIFLFFLHRPHKLFCFTENLWAHVACLDVHAIFLFWLTFGILYIFHSNSYAPESQIWNPDVSHGTTEHEHLIHLFPWHSYDPNNIAISHPVPTPASIILGRHGRNPNRHSPIPPLPSPFLNATAGRCIRTLTMTLVCSGV